MRMNARLMFSAPPKPTASAMRSTRFRSRLYAASGEIGAELFHHTARCCARLRPESATELAQAHASRLRQTLDGQHFGDVIAGIAESSGNPVILRCQIDGSRELRLSTMATMVDDKVLCHAFSDGEAMVLLDQSQRKIDAGRDACRSPYVAVSTEDAIGLDPDRWILSLKAGREIASASSLDARPTIQPLQG